MNNGILFESHSGNKYFYDDLTGHIVYIKNDINSIDNHVNKYRKIRDSKSTSSNSVNLKNIYDYLIEDCPNVRPYTSTCVPGEKIYVESDGNFIICEKTNNKEKIGNIYQGLDYSKIAKIMCKYNNAMASRCSNCTITRLCTLCFKDFYSNESFEANNKHCENQIDSVRQLLKDYVNLLEQNPKLFEEITTDYYSHIAIAGGSL